MAGVKKLVFVCIISLSFLPLKYFIYDTAYELLRSICKFYDYEVQYMVWRQIAAKKKM